MSTLVNDISMASEELISLERLTVNCRRLVEVAKAQQDYAHEMAEMDSLQALIKSRAAMAEADEHLDMARHTLREIVTGVGAAEHFLDPWLSKRTQKSEVTSEQA